MLTSPARRRKKALRIRLSIVSLLIAITAMGLWYWKQDRGAPHPASPGTPVATASGAGDATPASANGRVVAPLALPDIGQSRPGTSGDLPGFLPPEARRTLQLIAQGGPYPHRQDGSVFSNREGRLPSRPRGYYREYTVDTPGLDHRGTRRIVTGGQPPSEYYYTGDHYETFQAFTPSGARP